MNPQKIAILTDSCADLTPALIGDAPVYIVPLKIHCPDGEFEDGVTITARDVYARQAAGQLPKTSLPDGAGMEAALRRIHADGYEKIIAILLSSGLSGTYNMARVLAHAVEAEGMEMKVFDSNSGSLGEGALVLQTVQDINAGMTWEEITEKRIPQLIGNVHAFFSVDTLEYLVKGRIGKVTALAGTMLNIKPLLTFAEDGQLQSVAKVRGRKAVADKLIALTREALGDHKRYSLAVANGGAPEEMAELRARMEKEFPDYENFWEAEIDATLSVYIGPGPLGAGVLILD